MKRVIFTSSVSGKELAPEELVRIRLNLQDGRRFVADLSLDEVEELLVEGLNMEARPARRRSRRVVAVPVAPEKSLDELLADTAKELGIDLDAIADGHADVDVTTGEEVTPEPKAPAKRKAPAKKAA